MNNSAIAPGACRISCRIGPDVTQLYPSIPLSIMPPTPETIETAVAQYTKDRQQYARFARSLESLLTTLLDASGHRYQQVTSRAKTVESFREKISRDSKDYTDPIVEITDLCGLRIVCYDTNTLQSICALVGSNFSIDKGNSVDKSQHLDADRFGYLSVHYVVALDARRAALPEYAPFAAMKAEVQVRTALQHAWAALDHSLRYKAKDDAPKALHRRLYRISALLELADDEFSRLLEDSERVRAHYNADVTAGNLASVEIDADSLDAFLRDQPKHLESLSLAAASAGFALAPAPPTQKTPWTSLVRTLDATDIRTLLAFQQALDRFAPRAKRTFQSLTKRWREETASPRLVVDPSTILRIAALMSVEPNSAYAALDRIRFGPSLKGVLESELIAALKKDK